LCVRITNEIGSSRSHEQMALRLLVKNRANTTKANFSSASLIANDLIDL
jgi:hypothetical protein